MYAPLSVIVPTFNRVGLLQATLDSILRQTRRPAEIIVVDDGSTDGTAAAMAARGDAIVYAPIRNGGVVRARMHGLTRARHDWIALCDSDDLWQPDHVARAMALREAAPALDLTFANFRILRDDAVEAVTKFDTAPTGYWDRHVAVRRAEGFEMAASFLAASFRFAPVFPSALMFNRALAARAGGFDPSRTGNRAEDGEFVTRCLMHGAAGAVPQATVLIRKHPGNASADTMHGLLDEVANLIHLRDTQPGLAPHRAVIEDEIRRRRIEAAEKAFDLRDDAMLRRIARLIPLRERPPRLWAKLAVARAASLGAAR